MQLTWFNSKGTVNKSIFSWEMKDASQQGWICYGYRPSYVTTLGWCKDEQTKAMGPIQWCDGPHNRKREGNTSLRKREVWFKSGWRTGDSTTWDDQPRSSGANFEPCQDTRWVVPALEKASSSLSSAFWWASSNDDRVTNCTEHLCLKHFFDKGILHQEDYAKLFLVNLSFEIGICSVVSVTNRSTFASHWLICMTLPNYLWIRCQT